MREEAHLLAFGLYPLSFTKIQSAFTFDLLDGLRLANLEGKVSVYHYEKILQWLTSELSPATAPVGNPDIYLYG